MTSGSVSLADRLRGTFLFESLGAEQIDFLVDRGHVVEHAAGAAILTEGQPAEVLVVLLAGRVRVSKWVRGDDVELVTTEQVGVYGGAVRGFLQTSEVQLYQQTFTAVTDVTTYQLPAAGFRELMHAWFPMAVHLLDGLYLGLRNTDALIGSRERLAELGSLSAGLAHELNNPAAAGKRAAAELRSRLAAMRAKLAAIADGQISPDRLRDLLALAEQASKQAANAGRLTALEESDREDALLDWLDEHDVERSYELAPVLAEAGLDTSWADSLARTVEPEGLAGALRWLADTLDSDSLVSELEDAMNRISELVGAVKSYSHVDAAPSGEVDVNAGLRSTLTMLSHKIGDRVEVVRELDPELPRVPGFPGELNQVWTNLIDNAVDAMAGRGTLRVRSRAEPEHVVVEIADTGTGIPDEVRDRIFEPFFTTKALGQGSGLGLDISDRIVRVHHHGEISVDTAPSGTCFAVRLPRSGAPGEP